MTTLLTDLASRINAAHDALTVAAGVALSHALEAGRLLSEVKSTVEHGGWLPWLESNCRFSARTAQVYIKLHHNRDRISKYADSAHLSVASALKILPSAASAESTVEAKVVNKRTQSAILEEKSDFHEFLKVWDGDIEKEDETDAHFSARSESWTRDEHFARYSILAVQAIHFLAKLPPEHLGIWRLIKQWMAHRGVINLWDGMNQKLPDAFRDIAEAD